MERFGHSGRNGTELTTLAELPFYFFFFQKNISYVLGVIASFYTIHLSFFISSGTS
jgi:hypothetical protein